MATETKTEAAKTERDARIESLESQLEELKALIKSGAVNAVVVKDKQDREEWFSEQSKFYGRGSAAITQDHADKTFPNGAKRYRCSLDDGNLHPPLVIRADNGVDATGRYMAVCGITGVSGDNKVEAVLDNEAKGKKLEMTKLPEP